MSDSDALLKVKVNQDSPQSASEGVPIYAKGTTRGELCVVDFYTQMALEGRAFQVRAGTVTTHFTGDVDITDTAAEMCVDAPSGLTVIPCYFNIHVEALGGTVPIVALKSVGTASSAGDAFVPLPLYMGGVASQATARADAAGGVTVAAEVTTTTRRHFSATLATTDMPAFEWKPVVPPILAGTACFYVQVAATTTGPNYYANFDFIELPTVNIS